MEDQQMPGTIVHHPSSAGITTNATIVGDLRRSLQLRGACAGLTWGDFKDAVQSLGVTDRTPLASIEYGIAQLGTGRIEADYDDEPTSVEIREVL